MKISVFTIEMPSAVSLPTSGIVILSGTSGTGKTKRMRAVVRQFSLQNDFNLLHCCALDLIQEMAESIKTGAFRTFRAFLMRLDAMFIDNVWLLKKRPRTAHALFSLFESFAENGGLVVMADDLTLPLFLEWAQGKTVILET